MNILTLMKLEWVKQRRGWLWCFLLIVPMGTTAAMLLDFHIRYDYLLASYAKQGFSSWEVLLLENHQVLGWGMFLPMFIGIIYALLYQVEEAQQHWKHVLSLPLRKECVYAAKFLMGVLLSFMLIVLNLIGLIIVGWMMDFPEAIDWTSYGTYAAAQCIMTLAIAALHNWLSSMFRNQMIPIVIGFTGSICSVIVIFMHPKLPKLLPYAYSYFADGLSQDVPVNMMAASVVMMLAALAAGAAHFKYKDVL